MPYTIPGSPTFSGGIKSIQRGVAITSQSNGVTINISSVNPSKCTVSLTGGVVSNPNSAPSELPRVASLTSSTLVIAGGYYYSYSAYTGIYFGWEIVEYN